MNKTCLVIPCYNEESRLDMAACQRFAGNVVFVFVDDGSTDGTVRRIEPCVSQAIILHKLERNSGKAEAVRQGMLFAESNPALGDVEWFGFWDADLATPLDELGNMILYRDTLYPGAVAVFGSRIRRYGGCIRRSVIRHLIGRAFASLFRILFKVESYDSQCGAKIFKRGCVRTAFAEEFASRWIFDLEIMLRLRSQELVEYPLRSWSDVAGSKVLKIKSIAMVMGDVFKLWKRYG